MKLISEEEAFRALSEYYHHKTDGQAAALREALGRIPEAVIRREACKYWIDAAESVAEIPVCNYPYPRGRFGRIWPMSDNCYCSDGERRSE